MLLGAAAANRQDLKPKSCSQQTTQPCDLKECLVPGFKTHATRHTRSYTQQPGQLGEASHHLPPATDYMRAGAAAIDRMRESKAVHSQPPSHATSRCAWFRVLKTHFARHTRSHTQQPGQLKDASKHWCIMPLTICLWVLLLSRYSDLGLKAVNSKPPGPSSCGGAWFREIKRHVTCHTRPHTQTPNSLHYVNSLHLPTCLHQEKSCHTGPEGGSAQHFNCQCHRPGRQ